MTHSGLIRTKFEEFLGTYEFYKAQALAKHLREVANLVSRAEMVKICPQAPTRPWVALQEWEEDGIRRGQWVSDLDITPLP